MNRDDYRQTYDERHRPELYDALSYIQPRRVKRSYKGLLLAIAVGLGIWLATKVGHGDPSFPIRQLYWRYFL